MTTSQIEIQQVKVSLPVFYTNIRHHKEILELTKEAIINLRSKNETSIESNIFASYVSGWISHKHTDKLIPICDIVLSLCSEVSKNYYGTDLEFTVYNCWGAIYNKEDYAKKHIHFPALFSCVVYIEVEDGAAPLQFSDGSSIVPETGSIILFPGFLEHEVPKTNSNRIVVAMNIDRKPEI